MADSTVPNWMTKEFFHSCLQDQEKQPVTVTNYTLKPTGLPDGHNFGSEIYRIKVDFTKEDIQSSISFIVKGPIPNKEQFIDEKYEKEVKFYTKFICETYKYSEHDLVPKYYTSPNPQCVVLEDLSIPGYIMVDRKKFLDLKHCQLAIKAKAHLHALSLAVYRDNPQVIQSLVSEGATSKNNSQKMGKTVIAGSLRCMVAYLEDNSCSKKYLDIIKEASNNDKLWDMRQEAEQFISKIPLKVLIQLDPWSANMMFKYDNAGKVENIKLLDFQNLAFSTPIKEIVCFMSMCPNLDVRKSKTFDLYNLYINTLNEHLARLGCPERLNFEDVRSAVTDLSPLVLFITCSSIPYLLSEKAVDVKEFSSGNILNGPIRENPTYKLFQSPLVIEMLHQFLDCIDRDGVFDYVKEKITNESMMV